MTNCEHNNETKLSKFRKSKNMDSIISILEKTSNPISAEDIFQIAKKEHRSLALSTVYRIIEKLLNSGIIHETIKDGDKALYELIQSGHKHYMICTNCKTLIPVDMCPFIELEHQIEQNTGFKITGHKFEIYGICPDCKHNK